MLLTTQTPPQAFLTGQTAYVLLQPLKLCNKAGRRFHKQLATATLYIGTVCVPQSYGQGQAPFVVLWLKREGLEIVILIENYLKQEIAKK